MKRFVPLLLALAAGIATAQERPADHPYSAALTTEGAASLYRFSVPAAAYRGIVRRDLGDLRVFNAGGEPVPYAFAPRETQPVAAVTRALNLFPLYGDAEKALEATSMRVERSGSGTIVSVSVGAPQAPSARRKLLGYLLDASELKTPQEALLLDWVAPQGFSGQVRVEGSEDLKYWRTVVADAPILLLKHAGESLERRRVELSGARAKYLRLSFSGVPSAFVLKDVRVELRGERPEPAREWLSLESVEGKAIGELLYDSAGRFPVDRLRLALPELNTVAQVQFYSRQRVEDPWRFASSATVYRLGGEERDIASPEVVLAPNSDRLWLIKVDQKGGGFGSGRVRLELGWVPHEVVFAARGAGPFSLAYGNKGAKPGALPITAVIPRYGEADAMPARLAKVGEFMDSSRPPPSLLDDPARFFRGMTENRETKKWLLWSALVAGVLLLVWMALRLLRDLGKTVRSETANGGDGKKDPPSA